VPLLLGLGLIFAGVIVGIVIGVWLERVDRRVLRQMEIETRLGVKARPLGGWR
jgi:capsular polysaccharide biosynthesis protein